MRDGEAVTVTTSEVRGRQVLTTEGVLTVDRTTRLVQAAEKALAETPRAVVIDLTAVPRMTGAAASSFVVLLDRTGGWPDCPIVLAAPSTPVRARLDALQLTARFTVCDSLPRALVDPGRGLDVVVSRVRLPPTLDSPRLARQFTVSHLASPSSRTLRELAALVVSELVSNAVRYVQGRVEVRVTQYDASTRISVKDHSSVELHVPAGPREDGGRGLMIVSSVAHSWGVLPTQDGGKIVWALLDND